MKVTPRLELCSIHTVKKKNVNYQVLSRIMIEFISLCVCSACLSCICCLITGGLCVTGAGCRLRNKIVENHLPEDMQWLGNLPQSEYCSESDGSSSSDLCPVYRVCPKDKKLNCCCKMPKESTRYCSDENCSAVSDIDKNKYRRSRSSGKKISAVNSGDKSRRPKRWTFCFRSEKSSCVPVEDQEDEEEGEKEVEDFETLSEKLEPKSCRIYKKRKKSRRNSKSSSKTHCGYFKSCSCTNVKEIPMKRRSKKYKRSETSATRCPTDFYPDKRQPKSSRKSIKCSKNCPCKILTENKNFNAPKSERKIEKCCKCGAKN